MTRRTIVKSIAFTHPFRLSGLDEEQPAGIYEVETDEELMEDISFIAYRRLSTQIHLHDQSSRPGVSLTLTIDPAELAAALEADHVGETDGEPDGKTDGETAGRAELLS
jgi:hypothetical protein